LSIALAVSGLVLVCLKKNTLLSINIESTVFLEGDFDVNVLWENPDGGTRKNPKNIMIKIRVFNIAECREKLFGR
jgi:hypothetical protein